MADFEAVGRALGMANGVLNLPGLWIKVVCLYFYTLLGSCLNNEMSTWCNLTPPFVNIYFLIFGSTFNSWF